MIKSQLPPRMVHKFKLRQNKLQETSLSLDDQIDLMTNNLLQVKRQLTEENINENQHQNREFNDENNQERQDQQRIQRQERYIANTENQPTDNQNQLDQSNNQSSNQQQQIQESSSQLTLNMINQLQARYAEYLRTHKFSPSYEDKINQLLDTEEQMSIGNCIALFQMVHYFREILTPQILAQIQYKAYKQFIHHKEQSTLVKSKQIQLINTCLIQLISLCGVQQQQIIQFFVQNILENQSQFELSFKVLSNMGFTGIGTLVKIINQDFQELSEKILDHLSRTQWTIQKVLLPSLLTDLISNSTSKDKNISLSVLKKLSSVSFSDKLMQILVSMLKSTTINKKLLIQTIKSTGKHQGQIILLDLLKKSNLNQDIAVFIIESLSQKPTSTSPPHIHITTQQFPLTNTFQMNKLYTYLGQINDVYNQNEEIPTLYVNSRILCSMLEKLVQNYDFSNNANQINQHQCFNNFILSRVIEKNQQALPQLEVINVLLSIIDVTNKKVKLKQAAINAFSQLILPQNSEGIVEKISACLWSFDSSIKSITCLTLSKMSIRLDQKNSKVINKLSELLKDNYWKVRISACQAIGSLIHEPYENIIQSLVKYLKDGSINRELVCQTLIKIHPLCEQLLIEILKQTQDHKIQQTIICSFNQPELLNSQNLGDILETLFHFSNSKRKQIRYICMGVVNCLKNFAAEKQLQISYFKQKNIIPFYYNYLDDSCAQIRDSALNFILNFGSYAELFLIQGMTKGKINCKIQCAKGLGMRGVQNFRALLLGMRDPSQKVRRKCCQTILKSFSIGQIVQEYKDKSSQCISLIYNIKDLLEGNFEIYTEMNAFSEQLIQALSESVGELIFDNQVDQNEEIENEIKQFKESIKMRQRNQRNNELAWQEGINQDAQNINPNIIIPQQNYMQKNIKNQQYIQRQPEKISKDAKQIKTTKRYQLKLNEIMN